MTDTPASDRNDRGGWTASFFHRVRVAAAGYVAVAIFGMGAGVARGIGMSVGNAAVVGVVAAAPVIVALIGNASSASRDSVLKSRWRK